ncbi:MAG: UvrD-helicase domain-containing protein, partial [Microthrixaceae bacterium]
MTTNPLGDPPDQPARARIHDDLDTTLFVDAGAGSGKTTALVGRVVNLVATGAVELRHLAAITFTEKAGAELRDRVRRELQKVESDPSTPSPTADRCRAAVEQLDGAAIGTLHSFAQRILSEHPVEAKLPPHVEVVDEVRSGIAFDRRWARVLDELLEDPTLERTLLLLDAAGVTTQKLRAFAQAFDASWDLVEDRIPEVAPAPPSLASFLTTLDGAIPELQAHCREHCVDLGDGLAQRIEDFDVFVAALRSAEDDLDLMELLCNAQPSAKVSRTGAKARWRVPIDEVRGKVIALGDALDEVRRTCLQACARHLAAAMREHTIAAAEARRAAG